MPTPPDPGPEHASDTLTRVGLVVHPVRDIDRVLALIRRWGADHGLDVVQVHTDTGERQVAPLASAQDCDLVLAVGGDGTVLAATRAAADAGRPILGVACGSVGALTTVTPDGLEAALERFAAGSWSPLELPALAVRTADGEEVLAFNDLVVVRDGAGQISAAASVDDVLYGRFAGDGLVVSTHLGASGYGMAAGGPVIAPGSHVFAMTPLAPHGGCVPPIVLASEARLGLEVDPGHGGARVELDGQRAQIDPRALEVVLRPGAATVVRFGDEEPLLSGLRRRGIISDSPRILARDARAEEPRQPVS